MNKVSEIISMPVISLYEGEYIGIREARKHIAWYTKNLKDSASLRSLVCMIESYEELLNELEKYTKTLVASDGK